MESSRSEFITVRGLRYHVRHWGQETAPKIFMLHGWMDVSASFQFVVDCLKRDWHVIAPDWRGFGLSQRTGADSYWFADYLGDLEFLLEQYAPGESVNLVGHSMGGNIACMYAGVRPSRIRKLVNLEGFGLPPSQPKQAPHRYARWLDELRHPPFMRPYSSQADIMKRLQKTNPRLTDERAAFLAAHWAGQNDQGEWQILADPAHKKVSPLLYHVDEVMACWQEIAAPVLWVEAIETDVWQWIGAKQLVREEIERRKACLRQVTSISIPNAGHMLHHDQPQMVAECIEAFLSEA